MTLTEIGGGLEVYVRMERKRKEREDQRPRPVDAYCTPWDAQAVWANVVGIGEVPPHFMDTCSDREGAREGEEDGRSGGSHCQRGRGGLETSKKKAALRLVFMRGADESRGP